ncbi:hypothetical protein ACHAWO_007029 [Cyclotella atomus]|uniref:Uncharacterized protein n=1 Tax=Cyclotella atomus TaxID=382360 RepID=A0ABD3MQL4_9STRA
MYHPRAITLLKSAPRVAGPSRLRTLSFSSSASDSIKEQIAVPASKPYIPLYHHQDPSLFAPLVPGSLPYIIHNATAAFQAIVSLASSEELRQKFVTIARLYRLSPQVQPENSDSDCNNLYSGCIINTNVVGQSDMGLINVFSLFDGLSSPLYDMKGLTFDIKEFMDGAGFALEQFHRVDRDFFMSLKNRDIGEDYDFESVAKSNPGSLEHDLMKMTTPPFWTFLNASLKEYFNIKPFLDEVMKTSTPVESKIVNLALLSARVAEIERPSSSKRGNEAKQDETYSSGLNQVITQLEVLYEREICEVVYGEGSSNVVNVATFEACIFGDPNGEQLQWRLCQTRPASEFPYLV